MGGPDPDPLENIYAHATMSSFWREDMPAYAPDERGIYERNDSLVRISEGVIKGELDMTGSVQDIRKVCELFFDRQGSINALRGPDAPDRLFKVAGRYLEMCATKKERLDQDSLGYNQLPAFVARLFKEDKMGDALRHLNPVQRATFGTMLQEISFAYDANVTELGERAGTEALRNTLEKWALQVLGTVNGGELSSVTAPDFLRQYKRAAWGARYDIQFAQVARIPDATQREAQYRALLGRQLSEASVMLDASGIPKDRGTDGLLYEYFLPASVRFNALMAGQQDMVKVRRATHREDSPIDGMTHPARTQDYDKYAFDLMVQYPAHDRRVFLQTKLGQDTAGYDDGVQVYNYHTNVPDIRGYMAQVVTAMRRGLQGEVPADSAKYLRQERMRTAPLLPDALD